MEMISGVDITVLLMDPAIPKQQPGVYQTFHLVTYAWPDISKWGRVKKSCVNS